MLPLPFRRRHRRHADDLRRRQAKIHVGAGVESPPPTRPPSDIPLHHGGAIVTAPKIRVASGSQAFLPSARLCNLATRIPTEITRGSGSAAARPEAAGRQRVLRRRDGRGVLVAGPTDLSAAAQVSALPLQVDLLQLPPEMPASGVPALRGILDDLFSHRLSLPDTAALVGSLVQKTKSSGGWACRCDAAVDDAAGGASVPPRLSRQIIYYFRETFTDFWVNSNLMSMDSATQVFKILKQQNCNYLTKESLVTKNRIQQKT